MNRSIQLHDCEFAALTFSDRSTTVLFSPAYIHESFGIPGYDAGRAWAQVATLRFSNSAPIPIQPELPIWVLDGVLRTADTAYETFIPASGFFEGTIELLLTLSTADGGPGGTLKISGDALLIELSGEPSHVGDFRGYAS